jgi:hypothetical protein
LRCNEATAWRRSRTPPGRPPRQKFKTRYATLGFSDKANLGDGVMWPTDFALTKLTGAEETRMSTLLKKAVS